MQIPYFHAPPWIHLTLVLVAIFIGHTLLRVRARSTRLSHIEAGNLGLALVIGAAFGSHWLALAEQGWFWEYLRYKPVLFWFPFAGGASLGGMAGGLLAAWAYAYRRKLPLLNYLAAGAWAFPFAWIILRTGCFLAHDSIGRPYDGPLAILTPNGPRHDLALYEILWAAALSLLMSAFKFDPLRALTLSYGLLRAVLAPLRNNDPTLDWIGAALLIASGIYFRFRK